MAFDQFETHQRGPQTALRSKSPDLVLHEIWGHLCRHNAIRSLMTAAPLRITRQSHARQGDLPPHEPDACHPQLAHLPTPALGRQDPLVRQVACQTRSRRSMSAARAVMIYATIPA